MGNNRIFGNILRFIKLLRYKFVFKIPFSFNHLFAKMEDKKKSRLYKKYAEEEGKKREEERVGFAHRFASRAKGSVEEFLEGMGEEYNETVEMSRFFFKLLEEKLQLRERETPPSKEEVKKSILPGGGLSLLGLEILARKFGIKNFSFIPSSFRKRFYKENNKQDKDKKDVDQPAG
jgi:hypothetical protein